MATPRPARARRGTARPGPGAGPAPAGEPGSPHHAEHHQSQHRSAPASWPSRRAGNGPTGSRRPTGSAAPPDVVVVASVTVVAGVAVVVLPAAVVEVAAVVVVAVVVVEAGGRRTGWRPAPPRSRGGRASRCRPAARPASMMPGNSSGDLPGADQVTVAHHQAGHRRAALLGDAQGLGRRPVQGAAGCQRHVHEEDLQGAVGGQEEGGAPPPATRRSASPGPHRTGGTTPGRAVR